ncbi:S-adenosylmethionine:tRNA ribosyltransferase-isomerase, partial [[Eubacterium] cellulosolvens]
MKLSDFDYTLPKHLIAQEPAKIRDQARLLILDLKNDSIHHMRFNQLPSLLSTGDTLVLNDTRVVNARIFGYKPTGGKVELLILEPSKNKTKGPHGLPIFDCLIKGKVRPGLVVELKPKTKQTKKSKARILENISGGRYK